VKNYPLKLENWGEEVYILASRGHHDFTAFIQAIKDEYSTWPMGAPEHTYMKAAPCSPQCGEHRCHYVDAKKGMRGAFPVTYSSEDYGNPVNMKINKTNP
jgi:hypothetical protein